MKEKQMSQSVDVKTGTDVDSILTMYKVDPCPTVQWAASKCWPCRAGAQIQAFAFRVHEFP